MGVIYIYGGYNLLPLGAGMAWRERGMVTRDRRKMERDMVGEMAARHRKERIFFFFFLWRERNFWECVWPVYGVDILGL